MNDEMIVSLYWSRDETAVQITAEKYGRYLTVIANNILGDQEDSAECVNDTYLKAWNSMPQQRPSVLSTYLGRLTRSTAIDIYRFNHRSKRASANLCVSLDELSDCISDADSIDQQLSCELLSNMISQYLMTLPKLQRISFVRRYYFFDSLKEIAAGLGCSESKVKSTLYRARSGLAEYLKQEGYIL